MRALGLAALFACGTALAADFRTVGDEGAVLYDAPSRQATALFVVSRGYPLEVIAQTETWLKVRDAAGGLSWVERARVGGRRAVLVTAPAAEAHQRPEDGSPVAFTAAKDVSLDFVDAAAGWVHVRHADGSEGYLRAGTVWGE